MTNSDNQKTQQAIARLKAASKESDHIMRRLGFTPIRIRKSKNKRPPWHNRLWRLLTAV